MKRYMVKLLKIALILLIACGNQANADIKIVIPVVPPTVLSDGTGPYAKVVQEIILNTDWVVTIEYVPLARAINVFDSDTDYCYPFASKEIAKAFLGREFIDAGEFINESRTVLATLKSSAKLKSRETVKNKAIVGLRGEQLSAYEMDGLGISLYETASHDQSIKMLKTKRAVAILAPLIDLQEYTDELHWDDQFSVLEFKETFTCHIENPNAEAFLEDIGNSIRSLKNEGRIQEILGPLYLPD